jgi:glycerophosphoryl diester phosphodiesterase
LADLESLDVLGSGEGVPSLATVFEAVPDVEYVLDIKEHGLVSETLDLVDDYGVSATVSAFDSGILEAAADASDLPLAYLVEAGAARTGIETATALGCDALHPHWTACVDELVAEAHERGLEVNAWTVPSRRDANALEHVDIDGLIVDRPEVVFDRD